VALTHTNSHNRISRSSCCIAQSGRGVDPKLHLIDGGAIAFMGHDGALVGHPPGPAPGGGVKAISRGVTLPQLRQWLVVVPDDDCEKPRTVVLLTQNGEIVASICYGRTRNRYGHRPSATIIRQSVPSIHLHRREAKTGARCSMCSSDRVSSLPGWRTGGHLSRIFGVGRCYSIRIACYWSSPEKVDTQLGPDDYWTRRCVHGRKQTAIQSGIQG